MIKILSILLLYWFHVSESQYCQDGCKEGPVRMAPYICRCAYRPTREEISPCVIHCAQDALCRFCPENPWYGIPSLCPLYWEDEVVIPGDNFNLTFKNGVDVYGINTGKVTEYTFFNPQTLEARINLVVPRLRIEGEYNLDGLLCGDQPACDKGRMAINFDGVVLDWFPTVLVPIKCNQTYFILDPTTSNLTLINFNPVEFELKPGCRLEKCLNENWFSVLEKLRGGLERVLNGGGTILVNSIIGRSPLSEVLDFNS